MDVTRVTEPGFGRCHHPKCRVCGPPARWTTTAGGWLGDRHMPGGRRPLGPANVNVTEDRGKVVWRIKEDWTCNVPSELSTDVVRNPRQYSEFMTSDITRVVDDLRLTWHASWPSSPPAQKLEDGRTNTFSVTELMRLMQSSSATIGSSAALTRSGIVPSAAARKKHVREDALDSPDRIRRQGWQKSLKLLT